MSAFMPGLFSLLENDPTVAGLVGAKVYPSPGPQTAESPYITLQVIGSIPTRTFTGPTYDDWSVQVDCWITGQQAGISKSKLLSQIAEAVRDLLDDSGGLLNGKEVMLIQYDGERDLPEGIVARRQMDFTLRVKR